jgi:hypothetical protein
MVLAKGREAMVENNLAIFHTIFNKCYNNVCFLYYACSQMYGRAGTITVLD